MSLSSMVKLKRSRFFYVLLADQRILDIPAFLAGKLCFALQIQPMAFSVLTEEAAPLTGAELTLLGQVPVHRWIDPNELPGSCDASLLEPLVKKGLLLSTGDESHAVALREREARLEAVSWHPNAALYHFHAKQPHAIGIHDDSGVLDTEAVASHTEENFDRFVAKHGPPPPAFYHRREAETPGNKTALPRIEKRGELFSCLENRRTVRAFNTAKPLKREDLAVILHYTFGIHGSARLSKDVQVLKRTSPSGGSMHPIEVYPLVLNVTDVQPGIYHYDAHDHALVSLVADEVQNLRTFAVRMAANQAFAGEAHALLLMSARFERNFWKYRENEKTYGIILADAGHLSQSFYLVCAQLGLGSFFTAAINAPLIDKALGLDGIAEGAIGVCGCGEPVDRERDLGLPFVPLKTG